MLGISGSPGTNICLAAVDKALYLLRDSHRLTSDKMYQTMETYDTGCGLGGGRDSPSIFKNTGVMVLTNARLDVQRREDYGCETTLHSRLSRSAQSQLKREPRSSSLGEESGGSIIEEIEEPGHIRADYRETWIFKEIEIGPNSLWQQAFTIPSSITEWSITAVGLSDEYPMCVAEPLDILVRQDVFIQLHMPYSVVRKELVEILVTVFNYQKMLLRIDVYIRTPKEVCKGGKQNSFSDKKQIVIEAESSTIVKFVVVPLAVGKYPIEVAAYESEYRASIDAVRKELRVLPEGVETSFEFSSVIDPTGSMSRKYHQARKDSSVVETTIFASEGRQIDSFNFSFPSNVVPNSERVELSVIGHDPGPAVTTVIEGLASLLRSPSGNAETTMIGMFPNVFVLSYLTSHDVTMEDVEGTAKNNINRGIVRVMTYRKSDGSFSTFTTTPISSTWLTAFVNKVLCHARGIDGVFVDPAVTCGAMEWLMNNAQRVDGAFYETGRVYHREMIGGVHGDATTTAFILISFLECNCATLTGEVSESSSRATAFLEGELDDIQRPYAMAIVTYALVLANSPEKHRANMLLKLMATFESERGLRSWEADGSSLPESSKPYWYRARPSAITVEATGYALLAQLAIGDFTYSLPIAKWLSEQQNYGGGFASTQDTSIALQALKEYSVLANQDSINMTCSFYRNDKMVKFTFNGENALIQRHATLPAREPFTVTSVGVGTGRLNVKVSYNTVSEDPSNNMCPFAIVINSRESRQERQTESRLPSRSRVGRDLDQPTNDVNTDLPVSIEIAYRKNEPTNLAVIDVGIPSGYKPNREDLRQIIEENDFITRFEISQRSVIFYADHIPTVDMLPKLRLVFGIRREFNVGHLQPVAVKVYDYYNPTEECVKFYHPSADDETFGTLATVCGEQECQCAASCSDCGPNTLETLLERSCQSRITYAYKIRILGKRGEGGLTVYNSTVLLILREVIGGDMIRLGDDIREFWMSESCTACDKMKKNSDYLIIGQTAMEYVTEDNRRSYKYILDDSALIEFWPTRPKRKYRDQYYKLESYEDVTLYRGCDCR